MFQYYNRIHETIKDETRRTSPTWQAHAKEADKKRGRGRPEGRLMGAARNDPKRAAVQPRFVTSGNLAEVDQLHTVSSTMTRLSRSRRECSLDEPIGKGPRACVRRSTGCTNRSRDACEPTVR